MSEAIRLKSKITELNHQLSKIEMGIQGQGSVEIHKATGDDSNFYIPFNELPDLTLRFAVLKRGAMIHEELFKMLTTQYELAKLEEAKDFRMIQVLDRAVAPDRPSGPKRRLIVILSTGAGLFMAVLLAFWLEFLERLRIDDRKRYRQLAENVPFLKAEKGPKDDLQLLRG